MPRLTKTRVQIEGRWHEREVVEEDIPALEPWGPEAELDVVGRPLVRTDGPERVTGAAVFTEDLLLPGMLHARILRSPHPHARVVRVDLEAALALPGVRVALCRHNAPDLPWHNDSCLFDEEVRYQGDEVAVVAAEDPDLAADALRLLRVEYEVLPFVTDPLAALAPGAPATRPGGNRASSEEGEVYQRGDPERGFAAADAVVEMEFRTQAAVHNPLETHGAVASWGPDGLTVWESTQAVFQVRRQIARALKLPLNRVRVIKKFMGGGFGSKQETNKYSILAALLARETGRPVKLMLDRAEENLAGGCRAPTVQTVKVGARRDGTLTAIYHRAVSAIGAYGFGSMPVAGPSRELYQCDNVRTEEIAVFTNTMPAAAFRAPGYVEGMFALESAIEALAERLHLDPLDLRLHNYAERDQAAGTPYTSKGLRETYLRGAEQIGWRQGRQGGVMNGRARGKGMASQIWSGGGAPPAYAVMRLHRDGTADLLTGTQDIGTGTRTVLTQIAAEELGVGMEQIRIDIGDTATDPYAPTSAGSMTVPSVGPAVRAAAADVKRQLLDLAASILGEPAGRLQVRRGEIFSLDHPEQRVPFTEVTRKLRNVEIIGRGARGPNPPDYSINTFGAQFAEVEVDLETGEVAVLRLVAVHECGRIINPRTTASQIVGGIIQGVGYALTEQQVLDPGSGRVLNDGFGFYKVPTARDVPAIDHTMLDVADPLANTIGAKGTGEPPMIPTAPAIANAVAAALGVRLTELPLTRARVLAALGKEA